MARRNTKPEPPTEIQLVALDIVELTDVKRKLEMAVELFPKALQRSGIFRTLVPQAIEAMTKIVEKHNN